MVLIVVGGNYALAQPYGNEWIEPAKEYFKIKTGAEGIYRLTYANLSAAGFPVDEIDPRRIQLFHRGEEVAIYVEGEGDAVFNTSDFIEFYGQANDGTLDTELYQPSTAQPHTYYNLYSDTTAYFLTYYQVSSNGKRMATHNPFTGPPVDAYHLNEQLNLFTNEYSQGTTIANYASFTTFDVGEGFTGSRIIENTSPIKDIMLSGIDQTVVSGPQPQLQLLLVGRNYTNHNITIEVGPSAGLLSVLNTYTFGLFNTLLIDESIAWSNVSGSGELVVRVIQNDNGDNSINSNISVSFAKLVYAQDFDMSSVPSKKYYLQTKGSGGDNIQITNTPANANVYDVTDPDNVHKVIDTEINPNTVKCGFADATSSRILLVIDPNPLEPEVEPVLFRAMDTSADYIVISHQSLMKPAGGFSDAVRAYAGYRSSAAGGGFDTLVVDIQQLYDQFSYGETTPLAIYHFMRYMVDNGDPAYLFLIGKGLLVKDKFYRRPKTDFTYYDLVPTAGQPGADITFTSGLDGALYEAAVPTGRLTASNSQEIIDYLNKVVEKESLPFESVWRKKLLHLSGGNNELELSTFRGFVDGYKNVAENYFLGGSVTTQSKTTSAAVEFINVSEEVNNGLNQITFFGHSAPNVTDIDIGYVSDPVNGYDNKGRYPLVVMNGCNAGNIYSDDYIFGEDWILTPDKGSTDVIAHSSYGFSNILNVWSNLFYSIGYGDINYMDKSIGEIMNEVGRQMSLLIGGNINYYYITQIQQMSLHGDPAIKLFGTQQPDYEISSTNVEAVGLTDLGVTAEADSFALHLGVRNFAAYINDSLEVFVRRTLADNTTIIDYDTIRFAPARYIDTLVYVVDNNYANNSGLNSFEIVLDPANKIPELDDISNNRAFFNLNVPISGSLNLFPQQYGIVTALPAALQAQVSKQPSTERTVSYELDSTRQFTSLFKQTGSGNGSLVTQWQPSLPNDDSTAYYWRSRYENIQPGESDEWNESSFTFIENGDEGWAQIEYYQFLDNGLSGLSFNNFSNPIKFEENGLNIDVKTFGDNNPSMTNLDVEFLIEGQAFIYGSTYQSCANNRLAIVAFDNETATPYAPVFGGQVDAWTCGRSPQVINLAGEANQSGKTLDDILDGIQSNDYVLVFAIGSFNFNNISASALGKLENLGADISILTGKTAAEPYILYGKEGIGAGNAIAEIVADPMSATPTDEQEISYIGQVEGITGTGSMLSTVIGPAFSWDRFLLQADTPEPNDQFGVDIIGKKMDGQEAVLYSDIQVNDFVLNGVDAVEYPYLKLKYNVSDNIDKTPVQLRKWLVTFTPAAEGVLTFLGNDKSNNLKIELQEGDSVSTEFGFLNISDKLFQDSLEVEYTLFNATNRTSVNGTFRIKEPEPSDTTKFSVPIKTAGLVGVNNLTVTVNNMKEPEQLYVNNTLSITDYLTVSRDATNPLLDVSFDGRYIFDGEVVSPSPSIRIRIIDANRLLFKTDTTGVNIYLTAPCETCTEERVSLAGKWTPASKDKPFEINYVPEKLDNGLYTLTIQAEDASGNEAGAEPYVIHFEVINEATVTNFYPYPNPFSTSVRFVFTLTGSEIPDALMIRILTISGKVVRTITQDEIGPIYIGNNQTEYAWDGRDEFGDQLANGVYLYKVILEINGEKIDLRPSAGDKGFKNGYGKLYLLR